MLSDPSKPKNLALLGHALPKLSAANLSFAVSAHIALVYSLTHMPLLLSAADSTAAAKL